MIYVLTGEVHSGKSTALLSWAKKNNALGIVTPTIDGKKILYDLETKKEFLFEASENDENTIAIGNYFLHQNAFNIAFQVLKKAIKEEPDYIVLDEIGKLELRNEGLHDAIVFLLNEKKVKNIVFVVRDYLLEDVVKKYVFEYRAFL